MMLCKIDGCVRGARARGLCRSHYVQWNRLQQKNGVVGSLRQYEKQAGKNCIFQGCTNKVTSRGMCDRHYQQWYTRGKDLDNLSL